MNGSILQPTALRVRAHLPQAPAIVLSRRHSAATRWLYLKIATTSSPSPSLTPISSPTPSSTTTLLLGDINGDGVVNGLVKFQSGTSHVTLNNILAENGVDMVQPREGEYITIQNSVIRKSTRRPGTDSHCIIIHRSKYTKIFNNEIYDCTDGIQVWDGSTAGKADPSWSPEGTIIENNEFYITPALYADCGNTDPNNSLTPSGTCACAEDAIDIKVTTKKSQISPEDITQIRNNIMYGFRKVHPTCGGSGGWGDAIDLHIDTPRYVLIEKNLMIDLPQGIVLTGADHVTVRNNLLFNLNDYGSGEGSIAFLVYSGDHEIYHNTVINLLGSKGRYLIHNNASANNDLRGNLFVNAGTAYAKDGGFTSGSTVGYNGFFDTQEYGNVLSLTTNVRGSATQAELSGQYCYVKNKLTNPHSVCIANVIPQAGSPVINKGDPQLGVRNGVDDQVGVAMDLTGKTRDSQPDIGAFEYGANTSPTIKAILSAYATSQVNFDMYTDSKVNSLDFAISAK